MELTGSEGPPDLPSMPSETKAVYMVGDASGSGFGVSVWQQDANEWAADFGAWTQDTTDQSSNFREAYNLVLRIEKMVQTTLHNEMGPRGAPMHAPVCVRPFSHVL
jgi:hypothetical protein